MTTLTPLSEVSSKHGGKAAGLGVLVQHGFQVPQGVALDADAVLSLLNGDGKMQNELDGWLASVSGRLAIRSSAPNEDGIERSFAGMYETILKVEPSLNEVIDSIRKVSSSGMSERAIAYSRQATPVIPVVLQDLVEAEVSGVAFTKAIDSIGRDCAYIEWVQGFGDALVSGKVTPASISLPWRSDSLTLDIDAIQIGRTVPQPLIVEALARLIEALSKLHNPTGWDVEWAIDSQMRLWVLQLRPQTRQVLVPYVQGRGNVLPAAPGVGAGPVHIVDDDNHDQLQAGDVLTAQITEVAYVPAMMRASAIVTEEGGLLSHAAIVAREFGKPCVVGVTGARTLLKNRLIAEVDGTTGVVRQGALVLGGEKGTDIDWTYLYVYDRGLELSIGEIQTYVEPTLDGIIVYVDDDLSADHLNLVDAEIRRRYHRAPKIVTRDKRIWNREWRRFNQLQSVTVIDSLFRSAIAAWNISKLRLTIDIFKRVVLSLAEQPRQTDTEHLFWRELGAALHALVAVEVEGYALWTSYRDTATWRSKRQVTFTDFIRGTAPLAEGNAGINLDSIRSCLKELATLRNDAYNYFSSNGVFDGHYFGSRVDLVQSACTERGIEFKDEDSALNALYRSDKFGRLDCQFLQTVFATVPLLKSRHLALQRNE